MKKISSILCLALMPMALMAEELTYDRFIRLVAEKNVGYLAEQYNIDIAAANRQAAKVWNDPELSVEYGNNQDRVMEMGQSVDVGLSYDLDIAGVRRARIRVAKSEEQLTEASVAAYLSNLRLEASEAWAEAWRLKRSVEVLEASVRDMQQIAQSDSIRLAVGDVGRTDATQSRLEAQTLEGELIALRAEYRNALTELSFLCGGEAAMEVDGSDLPLDLQAMSEEDVCLRAEANRADLKAAELSHTLSQNNLRLVKASRRMELGLSLGYSYNTEVRNEIAPAPKFHGVSVGVTIPLKFSSLNKGERRAAEHEVEQSRHYYEAARLEVRKEALQAYQTYLAAREVRQRYDGGMLEEARQVVDSRKVGYQKGETPLIELLTAQQTYRDVMQGYIDACAGRFVSLAQLQKAMGE